jgi:hypothetical protein
MAYSGKYIPSNPKKYRGNINNIIWRSTWELRLLKFLDNNPNVLEFASEEVIIPYISPIDNKMHRYFVDFYAKIKDNSGNIKQYLIEVKPFYQTQKPNINKKSKKTYLKEVYDYIVNRSKWESATNFAKNNNMEFLVLTEKELYNK